MTKTITTSVVLAAALALGACNTVNGAGKDMQSAGSAVSDASGKDRK